MEGKVSFMECDIPEPVAFLQEGDYHICKDICIDGEVHCQQTCPGENCELDCNNIPCIINYETKKASVEAPERVLYITAKDECFPRHDCRMDVVKPYNSESVTNDKLDSGDKAEFAEFVDSHSLEKDSPERPKDKQNQDHQTEAVLVVATSSGNGKGKAFANISRSNLEPRSTKVESNEPNNVIGAGGILQNVDSQKPCKSENISKVSKVEDRTTISPAASKLSRKTEDFPHRNSSSFTVGSPSSDNLISGQLQCSDSISFRSNSTATTSARSFAFPILSSEWPSSPVGMVGGDRARFKKHRSWKTCFCW